ncbi:MAG: DUF5674 family protein [Lentisphaeria bacterium]|nr:DUF5674 family protein [Candidatus Neomarinimicrobiota bacterium]MCF7842055.1 DUF5674 family protein [Lentisphaeria bacterium]
MITILKDQQITPEKLKQLCEEWFGTFVKFVADVETKTIAVGGELHSDAEAILLEKGANQKDIWGANFYPFDPPEQRLEFTSLINIRPRDDNPAMEIMDPNIRQEVQELAETLLLHPDEVLIQGEKQ